MHKNTHDHLGPQPISIQCVWLSHSKQVVPIMHRERIVTHEEEEVSLHTQLLVPERRSRRRMKRRRRGGEEERRRGKGATCLSTSLRLSAHVPL